MNVRILVIVIGGLLFLAFAFATAVSIREREKKAAWLFALIGAGAVLPFGLCAVLAFPGREWAIVVVLCFYAAAGLTAGFPIGRKRFEEPDISLRSRFDERDTMFSRCELVPGSERFDAYYALHPERKEIDDLFRRMPGLLSPRAPHADPLGFAAARGSFSAVDCLQTRVEGPPAKERWIGDPLVNTVFLKSWARRLGAFSAGVTELRNYHLYSHSGRGERYGRAVCLTNPYALALTVEMEQDMVGGAPFAPIIMESARQYMRAGSIAVQLAETIRFLGYEARAHIDANYVLICPLVARDAGLGEIGRMGLLMTPQAGPRVRISVVTTDLPIVPDIPRRDASILDFCERCRKCAINCPSQAIPFGPREEIEGVRRWRINAEACFTYWNKVGTDCGLCIRVCPYSHPNNVLHRFVRAGIRRSSVFRRLAVPLDDIFYGRKPPLASGGRNFQNRERARDIKDFPSL